MMQHYKALLGGSGMNVANEMNFGVNHAPGAGYIARPVDLQFSVISVHYNCTSRLYWVRDECG